MSSLLFEHPLNERIRTYLKLEQLFQQANAYPNSDITTSHLLFFNAIFAIIDTLERNDIRSDLIKDLEKLEQNLVVWSQSPNIDTSVLEEHLKQTVSLLCDLRKPQQQWMQYKDNKFLVSLKQRFAMQCGTCAFDLPQLHFWLGKNIDELHKEIKYWINLFASIFESLYLVLKFIRLKSEYESIETDKGFYQDNGESLSLLRIKMPSTAPYYPIVSGNRFRYSIQFVFPCAESGRKYVKKPINFELAKC